MGGFLRGEEFTTDFQAVITDSRPITTDLADFTTAPHQLGRFSWRILCKSTNFPSWLKFITVRKWFITARRPVITVQRQFIAVHPNFFTVQPFIRRSSRGFLSPPTIHLKNFFIIPLTEC
ncbi:hypothetical protein QNH10_01455 [Sporosarcina thermotolerans]|uniref:hypothetical protein n=1 Tax=Sporosarcina thermotolerans TaxID=633404 RepID=UPI0024BCE389|nr:hypothetical protein [Sporosarcina thermotolerans]WHT48532.1 hypothetical protein QNH10_01455 [Sporosarcina thermotolerans]